jgi:hypothetical protein
MIYEKVSPNRLAFVFVIVTVAKGVTYRLQLRTGCRRSGVYTGFRPVVSLLVVRQSSQMFAQNKPPKKHFPGGHS